MSEYTHMSGDERHNPIAHTSQQRSSIGCQAAGECLRRHGYEEEG
jgi:hypothetical protein